MLQTVGVIHRDLKPDNILLHQDPCISAGSCIKQWTVKIADFNMSALLKGRVDASTEPLGAFEYKSLEQLLAHYQRRQQSPKVTYTVKADLWSIGVMMYECATKRLPFNVS